MNVVMVSRTESVLRSVLDDAKTMVLCVDGTSCCKKTSILASTGFTDVLKVQKNRKFINTNSFAPSVLGYISAGMLDIMSAAEPTFMDRSPLNVLEWHFLWKFMDKFYSMFGNVTPDVETYEEHADFFNDFDRVFADLKDYCDIFNRSLDIVCVIDSNLERCDADRLRRNEGTDYERSTWKFYTFMQNRMYRVLHRCIDLAWFDSENMDCNDIVIIVASCLKNTLMKFPRQPRRHDGRVNFYLPVPTNGTDFTLRNYSTFVYREIIRQKAQELVRRELADDRVDVNSIENRVNLDNMPKIANIRGLPDGRSFEMEPFEICQSYANRKDYTVVPTSDNECDGVDDDVSETTTINGETNDCDEILMYDSNAYSSFE